MSEIDDLARLQLRVAYEAMERHAGYRACGGDAAFVTPATEQELLEEAAKYTQTWWDEENRQVFHIGCAHGPYRPSLVFAIEAARLLCGGRDVADEARRLLLMALGHLDRTNDRTRYEPAEDWSPPS